MAGTSGPYQVALSHELNENWLHNECLPFLRLHYGGTHLGVHHNYLNDCMVAKNELKGNKIPAATVAEMQAYASCPGFIEGLHQYVFGVWRFDAKYTVFRRILDHYRLTVTTLLHHAMVHGPYKLYTLPIFINANLMATLEHIVRSLGYHDRKPEPAVIANWNDSFMHSLHRSLNATTPTIGTTAGNRGIRTYKVYESAPDVSGGPSGAPAQSGLDLQNQANAPNMYTAPYAQNPFAQNPFILTHGQTSTVLPSPYLMQPQSGLPNDPLLQSIRAGNNDWYWQMSTGRNYSYDPMPMAGRDRVVIPSGSDPEYGQTHPRGTNTHDYGYGPVYMGQMPHANVQQPIKTEIKTEPVDNAGPFGSWGMTSASAFYTGGLNRMLDGSVNLSGTGGSTAQRPSTPPPRRGRVARPTTPNRIIGPFQSLNNVAGMVSPPDNDADNDDSGRDFSLSPEFSPPKSLVVSPEKPTPAQLARGPFRPLSPRVLAAIHAFAKSRGIPITAIEAELGLNEGEASGSRSADVQQHIKQELEDGGLLHAHWENLERDMANCHRGLPKFDPSNGSGSTSAVLTASMNLQSIILDGAAPGVNPSAVPAPAAPAPTAAVFSSPCPPLEIPESIANTMGMELPVATAGAVAELLRDMGNTGSAFVRASLMAKFRGRYKATWEAILPWIAEWDEEQKYMNGGVVLGASAEDRMDED